MRDNLKRHNLTLEKVELMARLAGEVLSRSDLSPEAIDCLMKQVEEAGSLSALLPRLRAEKKKLESINKSLLASCNSYDWTCSELSLHKSCLMDEIRHAKQELKRLKWETPSIKEELEKLRELRDKLKTDIEVAKAVRDLIANPYNIDEAEFMSLIWDMASLWSSLSELKRNFPAPGYRHPQMAEAVRCRLAELLAPAVRDQFVTRWAYDICQKRLRELEEELKAPKSG